MNAFIAATEYALPDAVLDNDQLAIEFKDWTAEKIFNKTGIRERRIAAADECASDLAVKAAAALFQSGACAPSELDYLLYCTQSPDYFLPSTACLLQHRLGLPQSIAALDINMGCSGYIYGLGVAKGLIESGQAKNILFLTADTYSRFINPLDKSVRTLFGDAASATLISATEGEDAVIGPFDYGTDGSGEPNLLVPTGGMRRARDPLAKLVEDDSGNSRTENDLYMNGGEIFQFTLKIVPLTVNKLLNKANLALEEIDLFIFHQANKFILSHLQKKLGVDPERFWVAMEDVGNTVSSSIPIALKRALEAGKVKPGCTLMFVGFGVGYSWGSTIVKWK